MRLRKAGLIDGHYLVWKSIDSGTYHLCVAVVDKIEHHLILCDENGRYSLIRGSVIKQVRMAISYLLNYSNLF